MAAAGLEDLVNEFLNGFYTSQYPEDYPGLIFQPDFFSISLKHYRCKSCPVRVNKNYIPGLNFLLFNRLRTAF